MVTNRQESIASIIKTREPFLKEIEHKQEELRTRGQAISELEELHKNIMKNGPPSMIERLKDLRLTEIRKKINDTIRELEKPKGRFSRNTLNIGVIGRAGQGKSLLLQSLSGLSSEIIPTGSGGHCTGVRSLICHDPAQQPHGEISFYSDHEFVETVIEPYYEKLGLPNKPTSVDRFASQPLPTLPSPSSRPGQYARAGEMHRHLQEYKNYLPDYRPLINNPALPIPLSKVREYVAQYNIKGNEQYHKHMAVREAKIFCKFQYPDVGQIALIDMPGLGDTGVGAEERLIQALGESIDVALFILMPRPERGILADVDFELYDLTYEALPGIPIDQWSFMVLNHTKPPQYGQPLTQQGPILGDNYNNCVLLRDQIMSGKAGTEERQLKVADVLIADCSNSDEAKDTILECVLNHLVRYINTLDSMYLASWQKRLADLQTEINATLQEGQLALATSLMQSKDNTTFEQRFKDLWGELTRASDELLFKLEQEKDIPNPIFAAYFKETFEKCRNNPGIPTKQEILIDGSRENAMNNAFNHALDEMRTHLTRHFVHMDDQLRLTMNEVKERVLEVFLNKGQLISFTHDHNSKDLFTAMAEEETLPSGLRESFDVFAKYELSLRGFFQSRIRDPQHLNDMIPDRTKIRPEPPTPEGVVKTLRDLHRTTVDKIEQALKDWENEPSEAARAVVEEFIDQSLRSKGARDAWRAFYHSHKQRIWASDFEKSARWEELQRDWQMLIQRAQETNNTGNLSNFRSFVGASSL